METTLNIRADILSIIAGEARARGISCSSMIVQLLQNAMAENEQLIVIGRLVRYQKRREAEEWHTFHVRLREDEYEYFLDMRKFFKASVSLILAYAVKKFLQKHNFFNGTDNNRMLYQNYVIIREFIGTIPSWRLIWGYPPAVEEHILR